MLPRPSAASGQDKQPEWVPDATSSSCTGCGLEFSVLIRKVDSHPRLSANPLLITFFAASLPTMRIRLLQFVYQQESTPPAPHLDPLHSNCVSVQRLLIKLGYTEAPVKVCDACDDLIARAGASARLTVQQSNPARPLLRAEMLLSAVNVEDLTVISRLLRPVANVNDLTEILSPLSMAARKGSVSAPRSHRNLWRYERALWFAVAAARPSASHCHTSVHSTLSAGLGVRECSAPRIKCARRIDRHGFRLSFLWPLCRSLETALSQELRYSRAAAGQARGRRPPPRFGRRARPGTGSQMHAHCCQVPGRRRASWSHSAVVCCRTLVCAGVCCFTLYAACCSCCLYVGSARAAASPSARRRRAARRGCVIHAIRRCCAARHAAAAPATHPQPRMGASALPY